MSRVLETVLTGRNLLSPMLATASRDVVAFNSKVAGANEKAAAGAATSARAQQAAAATSAGASGKAATAAATGAGTQSAAADKIAASNVKASSSASASAQQQTAAHRRAAESATLAARTQESANRALAGSNAMLGTSLTPLTAKLGAVGLGLAYAGYRGMDFGSAMSQVQAASQETGATLDQLRDAAVDAGAKTQYSAVEAAQGITEMSKAGVSAKDILGGGLTGALNLAAAGQISVAEAAETGATALSVFGLKGNQMSHVADLIAAGAGKAQGSVGDLSAALNQSALVANQTGLSIEDTAGALAMFASNGLLGSDAGTSFKTMLQALTPNSVAASKAMDAIGFSAYDAQGQFVGMESVAGQLKTGLAGLTEEQRNSTLETIFGSDAVRAASVLYSEGAAGVAEWAAKVDDAGFSARQASQLNDNLRGDLERLGGAFDSAMTTIGGGAQGALREAVQMFTSLVDAGGDVLGFFTSLPGPVQAGLLALAGWALVGDKVTGALRGMGGAMPGMRDGWRSFGEALDYARQRGDGLGTVLRSVGDYAGGAALSGIKALGRAIGPELAVGTAVLVIGQLVEGFQALTSASDEAQAASEGLAKSLSLTNDAMDRQSVRDAIEDTDKLVEVLSKAGVKSEEAIDGLLGNAAAQDRVTEALRRYMGTEDKFGDMNVEVIRQAILGYNELATGYDGAAGSARFFADESEGAAVATEAVGSAAAATVAQTEEAKKALEDWLEQLQQVGEGFIEPLGVYQDLLGQKQDAERASAESTAASTESSEDSWKDYVGDVGVSLDEYATKLEEQITNQENWQKNIATVTQRGGLEVGQILAAMGVEGAEITAQMATATAEDFERMKNDLIREAQLGGSGAASALDQAMKVMAIVGRDGSKATARSIATELGLGLADVARIARQYGIELANGVNPLLQSLGKGRVRIPGVNGRGGGVTWEADGGVLEFYANGGMRENHVAQIARAGDMRVWAEPETGGEAYIPLAADKRGRSLDIWRETGKRLAAPEAQYFADGGFTSAADVPRPPSTAPYRTPISTAGDAAMDTIFTAATNFVRENGPPGRALQWAQSQVGKPYIWGGVGPAGYDCSGFMSAITNVLLGRSPHSRVGATASFPWPGFAAGYGGFTIGSTKDAGGGIGHMAGTLFGTNVESRGGEGVVVGPRARGASSSLFGTRAHLAMYGGGVIDEPVVGIGARSGNSYSFGERGPEVVLPHAPAAMPGYGAPVGGYAPVGSRPIVVSLAGATVTGRFDFGSDGLVRLVDGRIEGKLGDITDTVHYAGG